MSPKRKQIRLLVVDMFPAIRVGIRAMLNLKGNKYSYIVDEAATFDDALKIVKKNNYDIIIVAYELSKLTGAHLTTQLLKIRPSLKILGISEFNEYSYVKEMTDAGALGYLLKSISLEELHLVIETTLKIEKNFSYLFFPKKHTYLFEKGRRTPWQYNNKTYYTTEPETETKPVKFKKITLTKREKQIVQLLARNKSSKEIGEKFQIGSRTVDNFRANLLKKFNVKNTSSLVQYVVKLGLIKHKIKKGKQKK